MQDNEDQQVGVVRHHYHYANRNDRNNNSWLPLTLMIIVIFPLVLLQIVYTNQGKSDANKVLSNILDGGVLSVYIILVLIIFGFFVIIYIVRNAELQQVIVASLVLAVFVTLACVLVYIYRRSQFVKST